MTITRTRPRNRRTRGADSTPEEPVGEAGAEVEEGPDDAEEAVDEEASDEEEDDAEEADDEGELDAERENLRAQDLNVEAHQASSEARVRETLRQQSSGNEHVDHDEIKRVEDAARERVFVAGKVRRGLGVYVTSPVVLVNEQGRRCEMIPPARLPEVMVAELERSRSGKKSELARLIGEGVLEDLR